MSVDGVAATDSDLSYPVGVSVDTSGNFYIADSGSALIRRVGANGNITIFAGGSYLGNSGDGGPATSARLYSPCGLAIDRWGDVYICEGVKNRVRQVNTNGIITTLAGNGVATNTGDGGPATFASLYYPSGVALDALGNLYIADIGNNRVRKVLLYTGYPILTLGAVGATNAGNYAVVVTSPYGSTTSTVAALNVTMSAPQIMAADGSFWFASNQFGFNIVPPVGQAIVVDGSSNLVDWIPLLTNPGSGAPFYFFDPASTNLSWRFYRARVP